MLQTSIEYENMKEVKTPEFKFPLTVKVKRKLFKFQLVLKDTTDREYETDWLWDFKLLNNKNREIILNKLSDIEGSINNYIVRSISMERMREREIERKINRLFERY